MQKGLVHFVHEKVPSEIEQFFSYWGDLSILIRGGAVG
jgi:hypothetical protein